MNIRSIRLVALVGIALGAGLAGRAAIYRTIPEEDRELLGSTLPAEPEDPLRLQAVRKSGLRIRPLNRVKTPPEPGDWLARHAEAGQTFEQYRASQPNRPTSRLTMLYIQPWGDFGPHQTRLIADTAEMLSRFYGIPAKTLDRMGLEGVPAYARPRHPDRGDERLLTSYALNALQAATPKDAVAVLAVTNADLAPGAGRRWVFGQASLIDRVGICSLYRQGDPATDYSASLLRTTKTAVHETGHILGIMHCAAYECAMNGSGSREEADTRPLAFCSECEMKVWWACKLTAGPRYARLAAFAREHGLETEARFWEESKAQFED